MGQIEISHETHHDILHGAPGAIHVYDIPVSLGPLRTPLFISRLAARGVGFLVSWRIDCRYGRGGEGGCDANIS